MSPGKLGGFRGTVTTRPGFLEQRSCRVKQGKREPAQEKNPRVSGDIHGMFRAKVMVSEGTKLG